ncbi:MAG: zinc-dependent alcohol dehydrogenase [Desulfatibacillaceae bacterium]
MQALRFSFTIPQAAAVKAAGLVARKAFYSGPLAVVRLEEIEKPRLPADDWLLLKVRMCGFCASDLNLILMRESLTAMPFTSFPCTIGHEVCAEVVETGKNAAGFSRGDRVVVAPPLGCATRAIDPACSACASGMPNSCENMARGGLAPGMFSGICKDAGGGFAPYMAAHASQLYRIPDGLSDEEGALVEPFAVGLAAVMGNLPRHDDHVLVVGGGVIGAMTVAAIRGLGKRSHVTVVEPSPFHARKCRDLGADNVIAETGFIEKAAEVCGATSYKSIVGAPILMGGFDKVFDTVGNTPTLNASMRVLAAGGVMSVVGIGGDVKLDLTPLWLKNQTVKGVLGYGYVRYEGATRHVFDIAVDMMAQGAVSLEDMVTHRYRLDQYVEMIETNMAKPRHHAIKTVVSFT